jgi:hypothetical protein
MLFKIIDPKFVLSDTFKKWSLETKAVYTVICALANYKTGEFFHSTQTIANYADLCQRSVQRSLRKIEDAGIITLIEQRSGTTSKYKYNLVSSIQRRDDSPVGGGVTEQSGEGRLTSHPIEQKNDTQSLITSTFTGTIPFPNKKDLNNRDLTTTFGDSLISELVKKYGEDKVLQNAVVVMNMEEIKNKGAYLRASLKGGYVPTNQKHIEQEELKLKQMEREKNEKERSQEWEKHIERVNQESNDPLVQERIRAEIDKMNRMFNP